MRGERIIGLARVEHSRACAGRAFSGLREAAFLGLRGERILGLARVEPFRACARRVHSRACARGEHHRACGESEHSRACAVRERARACACERHSRACAGGAFSDLRGESIVGTRALSGLPRDILGLARGNFSWQARQCSCQPVCQRKKYIYVCVGQCVSFINLYIFAEANVGDPQTNTKKTKKLSRLPEYSSQSIEIE